MNIRSLKWFFKYKKIGIMLLIVVFCGIWWHFKNDAVHKKYMAIEELDISDYANAGCASITIDFRENNFQYLAEDTLIGDITFTDAEKEELYFMLEDYKFLEWSNEKSKPVDVYLGVGEGETGYRFKDGISILYIIKSGELLASNRNVVYCRFSDKYQKLMDSMWDFVSRYDKKASEFCFAEWRETTQKRNNPDKGQEMSGNPDYDKIWYFSINEFFGGHNYRPGASFIYDTTALSRALSYRTWPLLSGLDRTINYVDKNGELHKYAEEDDWWADKWLEQPGPHGISSHLPATEEGRDRLMQILKKYDVSSWREPEYNAKQEEEADQAEPDFKNSYECFIYLYDTDGRRLTLFYDKNTILPENYREFRQEIWDFEMEYIKENEQLRSEYSEPDWRKSFCQWEDFYLQNFDQIGTSKWGSRLSRKKNAGIEKLEISEDYPGGTLYLEFDFNENVFHYRPQRANSVYRVFTNDEKEELLALLETYKFFDWMDGYYYQENRNESNIRRTGISLRNDEYYLGVGEQQVYYNSGYRSSITYSKKHDINTRTYDHTYGLPDGYNELLDELWDFVFKHEHEIKDVRPLYCKLKNQLEWELEKPGIPDYDKIWYFSINEFFGGHRGYGQGPGASLTFDMTAGDDRVLNYRSWPLRGGIKKAINFVNADGSIQRYAKEDAWWLNEMRGLPIYSSALPLDAEGKERLLQILKTYDVASWLAPENYQNQSKPVYVKEGGYFCWNPDVYKEGTSQLEHEVRSSYDGFIYLYDTDGRRLRLIYDNHGLPENYNEFRWEIWDFAMEYINPQEDWRDDLFERGRVYKEALETLEGKETRKQ